MNYFQYNKIWNRVINAYALKAVIDLSPYSVYKVSHSYRFIVRLQIRLYSHNLILIISISKINVLWLQAWVITSNQLFMFFSRYIDKIMDVIMKVPQLSWQQDASRGQRNYLDEFLSTPHDCSLQESPQLVSCDEALGFMFLKVLFCICYLFWHHIYIFSNFIGACILFS